MESLADRRAELSSQLDSDSTKADENVSIGYTRTLDKAYRFFKDGHVLEIKYHPMPQLHDYVSISSKVLPSMRKDRIYNVIIIICNSTAEVSVAYCGCPAGLSGCCNHVTATLYCLEHYFHEGLFEDDKKGCTEHLQTWNHPRKRNVDARPTDEVKMRKEEYGVQKRPKLHSVNAWDCRPVSRRIVDPNKVRLLRQRLFVIEQYKTSAANAALLSATTNSEKRKLTVEKCMIEKYGTSCFLQLLDDEPAPTENRLDELKKERLALAATKKNFLEDLSCKLQNLNHDHSYSPLTEWLGFPQQERVSQVPKHLVDHLYQKHVSLDPEAAKHLERCTRLQSESEIWHEERKLRFTASIMKEVSHRKESTNCQAFIKKKLLPKNVDTKVTHYGKRNEAVAIQAYINYQHKHGINVKVNACGLYVDSSESWLAASPDGIVTGLTSGGQDRGCLEVKCPLSCEKMTFHNVCSTVSSFCLTEDGAQMFLSKEHAFFYQIQTQMHVTKLHWCDFVIWSPVQEPFVQRVKYDFSFMKTTLVKARKFYFEKFLPSVLPCMLITPDDSNTWGFPTSVSTKTQYAKPYEYVPVTAASNVKSKLTTICTPSATSKETTSLPTSEHCYSICQNSNTKNLVLQKCNNWL